MSTPDLLTRIKKEIKFCQEGIKELSQYAVCNKVIVNGVEEPLFFWLQVALDNELSRLHIKLKEWEEEYKFVVRKEKDNIKLNKLKKKLKNPL